MSESQHIEEISYIIEAHSIFVFQCKAFDEENHMSELEIEYLIRALGIGATYRGYRYLNYGVKLCLRDEDYLLSVSKLLYPQIAKNYHTTSSLHPVNF